MGYRGLEWRIEGWMGKGWMGDKRDSRMWDRGDTGIGQNILLFIFISRV